MQLSWAYPRCGVQALLILACLCMQTGCHTPGSDDPASIAFTPPPRSRLVLNRELKIAAGYAHVTFQDGAPVGGVDRYRVNCRLEIRDPGPVAVQPDSFLITRSGTRQEWVSKPDIMRFYRVFHLHSGRQPNVLKLVCQTWDGPVIGKPVTVAQVQQALGDTFSFAFARE